jgi:hypothetical protein
MNGLAIYAQVVGVGAMVVCAMVVILLYLLVAILYVFSGKTGRKARLKKAGIRGVFGTTLFLVAVFALRYQADARERANAHISGESISDEDGGPYIARYAYLGNREVLLRVYRRSDMSLIAERTYSELDEVKLAWTTDELIYDTSAFDGKGYIDLPPTLLDRILAKFP